MSFASRAIISTLAGIGAGLLGFWLVWEFIEQVFQVHPGVGHDEALLVGIFGPFVASALLVFRAVSRGLPRPARQENALPLR
jgi:hypothetical protein